MVEYNCFKNFGIVWYTKSHDSIVCQNANRLDTVELTGATILDVNANAHCERRCVLKDAGAILR